MIDVDQVWPILEAVEEKVTVAVPVALGDPLGAGLAPFGAADRVGLRGQQGVDHRAQQVAHEVRGRVGQGLAEQAGCSYSWSVLGPTESDAQPASELPTLPVGRFAREADMLPPLVRARRLVLGGRVDGDVYFEVQTLRGVADLLVVVPNVDVLAQRWSLGLRPVVDGARVSVLKALTRLGALEGSVVGGVSATAISEHVGISGGHVRGVIMPGLADDGWVVQTANTWRAVVPYEQPMRRIVAVEVKRDKWRQALSQASHHTSFADATYVALDAARAIDLAGLAEPFRLAGVGLVTVRRGAEPEVQRSLPASQRRPRGLPRAVVAERVAALLASGVRSGPVLHVFGKHLTTSSGEDPRRSLTLLTEPLRPE